jgi:hypothetical protein
MGELLKALPKASSMAHVVQGMIFMDAGRHRDAAREFEVAAKAVEDNIHILHKQAGAEELVGSRERLKKALQLYEKVWNAMRSPVAANNASYVVTQLYEEGSDEYRKREGGEALEKASTWMDEMFGALEKSRLPIRANFLDTRGWVLYLLGQTQRARRDVWAAARSLPNSPEVQYHLGAIEMARHNTRRAKWHLEAAAELAENIAKSRTLTEAERKAGRKARELLR